MKHKLLFLFCVFFYKAFPQNSNLQIHYIVENRYAIMSYGYDDKGVYIYDLVKEKFINKFKNSRYPSLTKSNQKLVVYHYSTIDIKTGKKNSNTLITDTIGIADLFDKNSKLKLTFEVYEALSYSNSILKRTTETLEEQKYFYKGDYHSKAGSPPYNTDYRIPEKEQIRYNYPYLVDTLSKDSFGVFNLKKQSYFNKHKISKYILRSANISPKRTFYYATFNKQSNSKFCHYIFNISNNKYLNLNNYDTSKCSGEDIHRVSFSVNDSFFATINACEKAIIYKTFHNFKPYQINTKNELIARIEFSPKSNYFITYSVFENDTTNFYKFFFPIYDSVGIYQNESKEYSMSRLQKPLYYVKVWNCKTMKPIFNFRTSSIKFGFSEDDNFLAIKIENTTIQTFFGHPDNNYSYYKDTVARSYLSIIDLNNKKEIKQLNIFKNSGFEQEYIWKRQKRPYFIFTTDNKKIITNKNESDSDKESQIKYQDIYNLSDGKSLLKSINLTKE